MTTTSSWLPLAEYSIKHHVSISTLRRRIKGEDIAYRFDDGKYFLLDETTTKSAQTETHRPSPSRDQVQPSVQAGPAESEIKTLAEMPSRESGESVLTAANRLLVDLKKAYTQILQEKEEQIMFLKEETVDLKTLIKILESENNRLRERL